MTLTGFIDHLVFRVSSLEVTERFYTAVLTQSPERTEDSLVYQVGDTLLFFTHATAAQIVPYDKEHVGLNHLAFGIRTLEELERIAKRLSAQQIVHSGIVIDRYGQQEFIWLDDPDGIRIEFYLRPE